MFNDYSKSDFLGFEWLSRKKYVAVQTLQGIPCIVFHDGPLDPAQLASGTLSFATLLQSGDTAFISVDGRLPILLKTDLGYTYYQWQQTAPAQLSLPTSVTDYIAKMQSQITRAASAAVAPAVP